MNHNYLISVSRRILLFCIATFSFSAIALATDLPKLKKSYKQATAFTQNNQLIVSTGAIERHWTWTGKGFSTSQIKDSNGVYTIQNSSDADWNLGDLGNGKVVSIRAFKSDDEHFTSEHLAVEAEIEYACLQVKYVIWAYPNAKGLRTQLWLKKQSGKTLETWQTNPGISETITLKEKPEEVTAFGYHAGLKADFVPYEILTKEEVPTNGKSEITSGLIIQNKNNGLILLKESQKHTHMSTELETGGFNREQNLVSVYGLGLKTTDIVADEYKFCWANWMVLFYGDEIDAQLAIKRFDRKRFPVQPERDIYIMANTWGSEDKFDQCTYKAREENVLKEIDACADLGIDLLQIDDGWQIREGENSWLPSVKGPTEPYSKGNLPKLFDGSTMPENYDVYPNGFGNVKKRAKKAGIKLGLWHAWTAPISKLKTNYDNGDFKAFKLDFANLNNKDALDGLYYKARNLIKYSEHSVVVNWDVTENLARMGFYFGRDCGNLYLANRKSYTIRPAVQYEPWQVLRDAWELADYMNLNKIQVTFQNKDLTPAEAKSDALKYSHGYNLAVTLMSSPIFFTELQFLSTEARAELKPVIAKYKAERDEMYKGYVFAIGDKPDNKSWTGFQNYNPETGNGYLTVFRELNNNEKSKSIELKFLENKKIELYNLLTGEKRILRQSGASLLFSSDIPASFLFYRYKILNERCLPSAKETGN